jgi:hypothetical protein
MPSRKVTCTECDWHGLMSECPSAPNPFNTDITIYGCPACRAIDHFLPVCDECGCWRVIAVGSVTAAGYRNTCSKHRPREGE